jgi:hypothetical protein
MEETFFTGNLVNSDKVSVKSQKTTEISHIDITFITVLMTMRV